jgi:hypothetical protein
VLTVAGQKEEELKRFTTRLIHKIHARQLQE